MADTPFQSAGRAEVVQGQAQAGPREPDDGKHFVHEFAAVTDRVITDVNHELAVQVPEGVGASTAGHESPLAQALSRGHVEDQFAGAADPTPVDAPAEEVAPAGDVSGDAKVDDSKPSKTS